MFFLEAARSRSCSKGLRMTSGRVFSVCPSEAGGIWQDHHQCPFPLHSSSDRQHKTSTLLLILLLFFLSITSTSIDTPLPVSILDLVHQVLHHPSHPHLDSCHLTPLSDQQLFRLPRIIRYLHPSAPAAQSISHSHRGPTTHTHIKLPSTTHQPLILFHLLRV